MGKEKILKEVKNKKRRYLQFASDLLRELGVGAFQCFNDVNRGYGGNDIFFIQQKQNRLFRSHGKIVMRCSLLGPVPGNHSVHCFSVNISPVFLSPFKEMVL